MICSEIRAFTELQGMLDTFREHSDHPPPAPRLHDPTPADVYTATPTAITVGTVVNASHYRLRYDCVGTSGKPASAAPATCIAAASCQPTGKRVIHFDTGELLETNTINLDTTYWPNSEKGPGRWPGPFSE